MIDRVSADEDCSRESEILLSHLRLKRKIGMTIIDSHSLSLLKDEFCFRFDDPVFALVAGAKDPVLFRDQ